MSNEYEPDIPDAKAIYFRGQQGEFVLVETHDGSACLYHQGLKIATFANRSAGYKGWGRAVRHWAGTQKAARASSTSENVASEAYGRHYNPVVATS